MGSKLPSCLPPEELSSIKMFTIENSEENPDTKPQNSDEVTKNSDSIPNPNNNPIPDSKSQNPDTNAQVKEEYEPPKKKAKKRERKPPKTLDVKQTEESDCEKKITPTVSFLIPFQKI